MVEFPSLSNSPCNEASLSSSAPSQFRLALFFPYWPDHPCHSVCRLCGWNACTSQSRWLHLCTTYSLKEFLLPSKSHLTSTNFPKPLCLPHLLALLLFPSTVSQISTKHPSQVYLMDAYLCVSEIERCTELGTCSRFRAVSDEYSKNKCQGQPF